MTNQTTDKPDAEFEEWFGKQQKTNERLAWQARQPEIDALRSSLTIRTACYESASQRADALAAEIDRLKRQVEFYMNLAEERLSMHKTYVQNEAEALKHAEQYRLQVEVLRDALEKIAKRPDLPNPERDADWKNCQKWSSHDARKALRAADQIAKE